MNRQQRRQLEKASRRDKKYTVEDVNKVANKRSQDTLEYTVEKLMSCFALALHTEYGFGNKRIMKMMIAVDNYMDDINNDTRTMEDILQELEDKTGVIIKCQ